MFKTERTLLRPLVISDASALFAYRQDAEVNKYQGWIPKSEIDAEEFIKKISPEFNVPESWYQFLIVDNETKNVLGDVGIHFMEEESQQCEVGITLDKVHHGKGIASEVLRKIIEVLFSEYGKHRIIASVDPNNQASISFLERVGFRKEAHFRKSLFINGEWVDDLVYALLAEEVI